MAFPADTTHVGAALRGVPLGPDHPDHHDALAANLNAVIDELGANPSGSAATVAARVAAVEADVAGLGADPRVFDVVTYGAVVNGATDDTAAWQAAINAAAAAGGGVVTSSKNGVSIIAGALQDTGGANAQLTLPSVHVTSGEQVSIVLRGLTPPPSVFSVIGTMPTPDNHLVLKSTLAAGTGAVIGVVGPSGSFAGFSSVHVTMTDLTVRTVANPTITAVDLRRAASADLDRVVVDAGSYDIDGLAQPTTATSYGLRLPGNNNGAHVRLGMVDVAGFYTGFEFAEHATGHVVSAWGCRVAAEFDATNHASTFLRFMAVHCTVGLKFTGAHSVDVWQFDIEHASSSQGWRQTTYDIDDVSNYGSGFVRWWAVLAGTGAHNSFTKNGGSGITASRVGAAIGAGGGGTTVYEYQDRLTAATGNSVLTLGASPVTNSPDVWVNGAKKWAGTDYTISGTAITFGSPLTAGDIVGVHYRSTASSASASGLSNAAVNIVDTFTRADSGTTMGTTSTGAAAWTALAGTWGIVSNTGYMPAAPTGGIGVAAVDSGVPDCTISAKITLAAGNPNCGIAFRATNAANCYVVEVQVGASYTPKVYKIVGGTVTQIATGAAVTFASGDTLSVVLSGSSITVKRNGTAVVSTFTDSTYTTQTKHGLYSYAPSPGTDGLSRFDDFSIQP